MNNDNVSITVIKTEDIDWNHRSRYLYELKRVEMAFIQEKVFWNYTRYCFDMNLKQIFHWDTQSESKNFFPNRAISATAC